jgi:hypothetical protein
MRANIKAATTTKNNVHLNDRAASPGRPVACREFRDEINSLLRSRLGGCCGGIGACRQQQFVELCIFGRHERVVIEP